MRNVIIVVAIIATLGLGAYWWWRPMDDELDDDSNGLSGIRLRPGLPGLRPSTSTVIPNITPRPMDFIKREPVWSVTSWRERMEARRRRRQKAREERRAKRRNWIVLF
jgi:hypothetical protein